MSFNGLGVMMFRRLGGKGSVTDLINQSISDEGVCRRAPATPGLCIQLCIFISIRLSLVFRNC